MGISQAPGRREGTNLVGPPNAWTGLAASALALGFAVPAHADAPPDPAAPSPAARARDGCGACGARCGRGRRCHGRAAGRGEHHDLDSRREPGRQRRRHPDDHRGGRRRSVCARSERCFRRRSSRESDRSAGGARERRPLHPGRKPGAGRRGGADDRSRIDRRRASPGAVSAARGAIPAGSARCTGGSAGRAGRRARRTPCRRTEPGAGSSLGVDVELELGLR